MFDQSTLQTHLDALGWRSEPYGDDTWRSVHDTKQGEVVVYLRLSKNWLVASVVPFLSTAGDNSFELARWLLRMNRDMKMTKFAYDEDGDVILTVELPTESLDFEEVQEALQSILADAVRHRATLRAASDGATSGSA